MPSMPANATRRTLIESAAVAGIMILATAVLFAPWMAHLSTALIGPPEDNLQDFWNSWYAAVGSGSKPGHFFYHRSHPLPGESAAQLSLLRLSAGVPACCADASSWAPAGETLIFLQNLTLLLSFPVAGAGAYFLVRHFTRNAAASRLVGGGFVFAFNPWHVAQTMHHAHVSWIGFIPFFALAYLLALERKSWMWLCISILFYALSALSCWYYLFYNAFFILFHAIYLRIREANELPKGLETDSAPLACMAGTAIRAVPADRAYGNAVGARPTPRATISIYVADLFGYVLFPPNHLLGAWTRGVYARLSGNPWESAVYLPGLSQYRIAHLVPAAHMAQRRSGSGLCTMRHDYVLCVRKRRNHSTHSGHDFTYIHLPDIVLAKLPFVANVRTPARADRHGFSVSEQWGSDRRFPACHRV